jgi:hypothetical protein
MKASVCLVGVVFGLLSALGRAEKSRFRGRTEVKNERTKFAATSSLSSGVHVTESTSVDRRLYSPPPPPICPPGTSQKGPTTNSPPKAPVPKTPTPPAPKPPTPKPPTPTKTTSQPTEAIITAKPRPTPRPSARPTSDPTRYHNPFSLTPSVTVEPSMTPSRVRSIAPATCSISVSLTKV